MTDINKIIKNLLSEEYTIKILKERAEISDKILLSVSEMAELLGISRTAVQKQINKKKIIGKRIGSTFIIILNKSKYYSLKNANKKIT